MTYVATCSLITVVMIMHHFDKCAPSNGCSVCSWCWEWMYTSRVSSSVSTMIPVKWLDFCPGGLLKKNGANLFQWQRWWSESYCELLMWYFFFLSLSLIILFKLFHLSLMTALCSKGVHSLWLVWISVHLFLSNFCFLEAGTGQSSLTAWNLYVDTTRTSCSDVVRPSPCWNILLGATSMLHFLVCPHFSDQPLNSYEKEQCFSTGLLQKLVEFTCMWQDGAKPKSAEPLRNGTPPRFHPCLTLLLLLRTINQSAK